MSYVAGSTTRTLRSSKMDRSSGVIELEGEPWSLSNHSLTRIEGADIVTKSCPIISAWRRCVVNRSRTRALPL